MRKSYRMRLIEQQFNGADIREVIKEQYEKHQSIHEVAKAIGVDYTTVSHWIAKLGLQFKTILIDAQ